MAAMDEAADWRSLGACLSADPDLFFPISPGGASKRQEKRAKAVCGTCLVTAQCLAFAMETRQVHGVWGGLGEEELARLRSSLRAPGAGPERVAGTGRVAGPGRRHRRERQREPQSGLPAAAGGSLRQPPRPRHMAGA